jgi:hypothetical protein
MMPGVPASSAGAGRTNGCGARPSTAPALRSWYILRRPCTRGISRDWSKVGSAPVAAHGAFLPILSPIRGPCLPGRVPRPPRPSRARSRRPPGDSCLWAPRASNLRRAAVSVVLASGSGRSAAPGSAGVPRNGAPRPGAPQGNGNSPVHPAPDARGKRRPLLAGCRRAVDSRLRGRRRLSHYRSMIDRERELLSHAGGLLWPHQKHH